MGSESLTTAGETARDLIANVVATSAGNREPREHPVDPSRPGSSAPSGRQSRGGEGGQERGAAGRRRRAPAGPNHTRYDHSLAEFPAFRFGRRRTSDEAPLCFEDTIRGPNGKPLERRWTVHASPKHGYGGASTQAVLFALHQCWKESGFRGPRIYLGSLRRLFQMLHPGKNPAPKDYARLRRDLDILCGYEFDCENAFWDPVSRSYGTMRSWHLFTGWFEPRKRGSDSRQEELPFTFVEVSDTFRRVAEQRGFFVTGFDLEFFNSLRPTEQTLALYLSKMFASQEKHMRYEDQIFAALPIEGSSRLRSRQTLRDAARGLMDKGYPYLAGFKIEKGRAGRYVAGFYRKGELRQEYPTSTLTPDAFPPEWRDILDEILRLTKDEGSLRMYANSIQALGTEAVRYAAADLKTEMHIGEKPIANPGAWLNTKLLKMAEERGIQLRKHGGDRRSRRTGSR